MPRRDDGSPHGGVLAAIVVAGLALALFWPLVLHRSHLVPFHTLAGDPAIVGLDAASDRPDWRTYDLAPVTTFYAEKALVARSLHGGELPLWNPWNGLGFPLLADGQSQPLSPFFLPFLIRPTPWVYSACLVIQLLFGAWGMSLFLGKLGSGQWPRVLGAAVFAFNPYTLKFLAYSNVWAYAWLPWLFLAAERLAAKAPGSGVVLAICMALTGFCGHPEEALLASGAAFLYLLLRSAGRGALGAGSAFRYALVPVGAALLSAWWILPFLEWVRLSWSPRMGHFQPSCYAASALFMEGSELLWLPLMLVLAATGLGRGKPAWAMVPMLLGAVLLLLPSPAFVQGLLSLGFMSGRYTRSLAWFVLVAWAAFGFGRWLSGEVRGIWKWAGLALQLAWMAAAFFVTSPLQAAKGRVPLSGEPVIRSPMVWGFMLVGLLLWLLPSGKRPGEYGYRGPLLTAVIVGGLLLLPSGGRVMWNTSQPRLAGAVAKEVPTGGERQWFPTRDGLAVMSPNLSALFGVRDARFAVPLAPQRLMPLAGSLAFGFQGFGRWEAARLDMAGVGLAWGLRPESGPLVPNRNPEALSRGFWVPNARSVHDPAESTAAALEGGAWRHTAFIEGLGTPLGEETEAEVQSEEGTEAGVSIPLQAEPLTDTCNTTRWRVACPSEGWFVLRDLYWPGWRATVDGRPVRISPADGAFRAVRVGRGTHEVEFTYRPLSFLWGSALTVLTCLGLALWSLRGRLRRRA